MRLDEAAIQGFLATREVVVLATVQADGAPLAMPMWFLHGPSTLTMISVAETQKVRNLRRDARVCVLAEDVAARGPARAALGVPRDEFGVGLERPSVLGLWDDYGTRSGFIITPVVAWAGDAIELAPNPAEVAHVYRVPLAGLEKPDVPRLISIPESDRPVIQVPLLSSLIHAPTAAVIYQIREVVVHGRSTRVGHFEQPTWAWK